MKKEITIDFRCSTSVVVDIPDEYIDELEESYDIDSYTIKDGTYQCNPLFEIITDKIDFDCVDFDSIEIIDINDDVE